ncbi:finger putative transcription factor family-related [Holotrichia oblita]|uniref:Finger putative transcription factor family-related n=1 Tax=Holotrichia oblita TaxID=644536 RepID=A0ACB9TDG6_HOLOL|nr:finger putative transcription factor family-related [Holotrichia oblita]
MLSEILTTFASIQIAKGDGLPEQICLNCVQEINRIYLFQKLCQRSDFELRQYLHPIVSSSLNMESNFINIESSLNDIKNSTSLSKRYSVKQPEEIEQESGKSHIRLDEEEQLSVQCEKQRGGAEQSYQGERSVTFTFKSELLLTRHKLSHKTEDINLIQNPKPKVKTNKAGIIKRRNLPRTCNICNKTFRFHSNLERHKLTHTGEKPYLCNICGKRFAQLSYLKIHSFIHTGEKPYKCEMCHKSFAASGTLVTHMRTHTGERPHICKICGKNFPQSGYLTSHIRTHTGEKPVECKICNRRFNQRGRLNIHMRVHSGEKPYSCKDCGRSFSVKGTLKKHIRTHTGERPYVCTVCGQAFAQNGTLTTHMKVHKSKS